MTEEPTWKSTLPFPRKWIFYIGVKFLVLGLVIYVTLRTYGVI